MMMKTFRKLMGFASLIGLLLSIQNCCKKDPRWCEAPKKDPKDIPGSSKLYGVGDRYVKIPGNDPNECGYYGCDSRLYPVEFVHRGASALLGPNSFPFLKGFRRSDGTLLYIGWNFKDRTYPLHWGIDMPMTILTPVYSTITGRVVVSGDLPIGQGCGSYVVVEDGGFFTYYCHLSARSVNLNQSITAGDLVGYSGNTGNSSGPHVHYATCPLNTGDSYALYSYCYNPIIPQNF